MFSSPAGSLAGHRWLLDKALGELEAAAGSPLHPPSTVIGLLLGGAAGFTRPGSCSPLPFVFSPLRSANRCCCVFASFSPVTDRAAAAAAAAV